MPTTHTIRCAQCASNFTARTRRAVTCSAACRNRRYRARQLARRVELARDARRAARSRDIAELERVAQRIATLLAA